MKIKRLTCVVASLCGLTIALAQTPALIPLPASMEKGQGSFCFKAKTKVWVDAYPGDSVQMVWNRFASDLKTATGIKCGMAKAGKADIRLEVDGQMGPEAYSLDITTRRVHIRAAKPAGFFLCLANTQTALALTSRHGWSERREREGLATAGHDNHRPTTLWLARIYA